MPTSKSESESSGGYHKPLQLPSTKTEEHLRHKLLVAKIGSWDWDIRSNKLIWSETQEALYGMKPGEFDGSFKTFLQAVHSDDRDQVLKAQEKSLDQKTPYRTEYRVLSKNGATSWLEDRGQVIQDENGKVIGIAGISFNISELKDAENRLRDSREYFRLAVEAARLGTWSYNHDTDEIHMDKRMRDIWGDSRETISVSEMMDRVHPGDRPEVQQAVADALDPESDGQYTAEYRILWDDGTVRWISENGQARFVEEEEKRRAIGGLGTALDITNRKRNELRNQLLAQLNNELISIDDPDVIMATIARLLGEHLEADRCAYGQAEEDNHVLITGDYTRGDTPSVAGRWLLAQFGEEATKQTEVVDDITCSDRFTESEIEAYQAINVQAKITVPLHKEGRFVGGITVHQGTPRNWLPDEIELVHTVANRCWEALERTRLTHDLQKMNETLEERVEKRTSELLAYQEQLRSLAAQLGQAEESQRQRLATELHDNLGQLLTVCKMKLGVLQMSFQSEEPPLGIDEITELVDDAIFYTRSLMSELKPPPLLNEEDLASVIEWVADTIKKKYGLELTVTDDGLPKPLDKEAHTILIQCTRELLFNVVKHAEVDEAHVEISRHGDQVRLSIMDKGKGFEFMSDQTPTKEGGFGLFSIRERIAWLNGHLDIYSVPGDGTEVIINVPLKVTSKTETEPRVQQKEKITAPPGSPSQSEANAKIRILLVDDHQMVRTGLRKIIEEEEDMQVVAEASDGEEAINLTTKHAPDVVIMDVNMPGMNGIDATRTITAETSWIRVIGLSLHDSKEVNHAMREAGAVAYLTKSELYQSLCATIRSEGMASRQT